MPDLLPERDPLEQLAADYMERLRRGEKPSVEEYALRHPDLAEEIRELFPTIAVTERLKVRQAQTSAGRASLGGARPERLGDFRLIRELGRGGMGVVFEAEQESLGRRVAVKVLPRQWLVDEKQLQRFEREARIAASLHHTNIVEVFGVGQQDGFHYFVMQLIDGVGLDAVLAELAKLVRDRGAEHDAPGATEAADDRAAAVAARRLLGDRAGMCGQVGPDYWLAVARIGLQAAEALSYAHRNQVLHRDIKPANLLLGGDGNIWISDFGLARGADSKEVSLSRDVVGTLRYMPPEQMQGKSDQRGDIYSLGLTLYELLARRPAFGESDPSRLLQRIAQGESPPPPRSVVPGLPRDLETIVLKAISPEPSHRYPAAQDLADDLRCFLEDRPVQARRVGPVERLGRWCRRNRTLAAVSGIALALLMAVAVVASVGYVRTQHALEGEAAERTRAEATSALAAEVLDRVFDRLSPSRMRVRPQAEAEGMAGTGWEDPGTPILSKESAALLEEMLPFYDRLAKQTGERGSLRISVAEANRRVGAIRFRLGQMEEAASAYRRAAHLFERLRGEQTNLAALSLALAKTENELGRICAARRQSAEARDAHMRARALLESATQSAAQPGYPQFELARTLYFLSLEERPLPSSQPEPGERPASSGSERQRQLAQAVALLQNLERTPDASPECRHLLALCFLEGAPVGGSRGPTGGGGAEQAIEILESLVGRYPGVPDYAYDLSEAYARVRMPHPPVEPGVGRAIEERLSKALALQERLVVQYPEVPDFQAALARLHEKRGALCRQMDDWAGAEASFRLALAAQEKLRLQSPQAPGLDVWMATFQIGLGDVLVKRGKFTEARQVLEAGLAWLTQAGSRSDTPRGPHELAALGYSRLAAALRQTGDKAGAALAEQRAQEERKSR